MKPRFVRTPVPYLSGCRGCVFDGKHNGAYGCLGTARLLGLTPCINHEGQFVYVLTGASLYLTSKVDRLAAVHHDWRNQRITTRFARKILHREVR